MLPLVFMTGFLSSRQPDLLASDDLSSFVRKPINGVELNTVITGLLALRDTRAEGKQAAGAARTRKGQSPLNPIH